MLKILNTFNFDLQINKKLINKIFVDKLLLLFKKLNII